MKLRSFRKTAVGTCLVLLASVSVAIAGTPVPPNDVVPEPSTFLIWAGIAGTGGAVYWWRNHRSR
jgi:hypothetical protein